MLSVQHSSISVLTNLLRACKTVVNLNQFHAHIIRRGLDQDHFIIAQLICLCTEFTKPTNLSYPISIFNSVTYPNIYLWNIMIKAHTESSSLNQCLLLFNEMRRSLSVVPDKYTFPSLIKVCSNSLALREGMVIHGLSVRYGTCDDVFVGSTLIDFYGKCNVVDCARKVFDEMSVKNEVSWTSLMVGYLNVGDLITARSLFDEMPKRNVGAWNAIIRGLVKFGDLINAKKCFDEMPLRNEVSFTTLIDGYAKNGDMAAAKALFDELPKKDLVSWSTLISGYVQNGKPGEALKVFGDMWAMNVKPDEYIIVSLMSACSQLGSLELAKWIESYMINNTSLDLKRAHIVCALVDMNAKCGNMERATFLFEGMPKRDLISYCSMIQGLCIHGLGVQAVHLFDRMIDEGIKPDNVAFTVILTACSRAELVNDGCRYFDAMINKYSIVPSPDHYACMVNLLGKSGKLKAAYELLHSKPVESYPSAWGALLEACSIHSDIELAEVIASKLHELEPQNGGSYVLLSNMYAEANRWLDVFNLRVKMSEKGIRKVPGCSFVESTTPG